VSALVLSTFPGVDLFGRGFELEGYCVVRGPDIITGGDMRRFHPVPGKFDGVIGGPPCQAWSTYANLNRSLGNRVADDLVPEFCRVVEESECEWFVMENVPAVPDVDIPGFVVHRLLLDARWLGLEQSRKRCFQFGTRRGARLDIGSELSVLESPTWEPACLASEGAAGKIGNKRARKDGRRRSTYTPRRSWAKFCELQGVPADFLEHAPWTLEGKYRAVGNGVPVPVARAIARAVRHATNLVEV